MPRVGFHDLDPRSLARLVRGCLALGSMAAICAAAAAAAGAQVAPSRWEAVARALHVPGEVTGEAFRVEFAPLVRQVRMRGVLVQPGALEPPWAAFEQPGILGLMEGRLLLPAERAPQVTRELVRAGLRVTALIDPLPGSAPPVVAIHFRGLGDTPGLARQLHAALGRMLAPPSEYHTATAGGLDIHGIEKILGRAGEPVSGALVFHIARSENVKCCGMENDPLLVFSGIPLGPPMGVESRFAFQSAGAGAAVTGQLIVLGQEAGPVEHALEAFGIDTVSLAEPFVDEQPRMLALHLWGTGTAAEVASGLRAALEGTKHLPALPGSTP